MELSKGLVLHLETIGSWTSVIRSIIWLDGTDAMIHPGMDWSPPEAMTGTKMLIGLPATVLVKIKIKTTKLKEKVPQKATIFGFFLKR